MSKVIDTLTRLIGKASTQLLVEAHGGQTLFFPTDAERNKNPPIPIEHWALLCRHYKGTYLFIPKGHHQALAARNHKIRIMRQQGLSISEICRQMSLSNRTIARACAQKNT